MNIADILSKPTAHTVSPALFGANMEVTRRTWWSGLGAQMINNRKLAARDGAPGGWTLEGAAAYAPQAAGRDGRTTGMPGGCVTLRDGGVMRTVTGGVAVTAGVACELRLMVKAEGPMELTVTLEGAPPVTLAARDGAAALEAVMTPVRTHDAVAFSIRAAGTGSVRVTAVSLLPEGHLHGMRRDVLELLKSLEPDELRYPGGCYAEEWVWKDSLLPPDERPVLTNTLYQGDFLLRDTFAQDCQDLGLDEFLFLCAYTGARPSLTVPLIRRDPQSAADLVEYCNGGADTPWGAVRARRGHPAPYAVRDWYAGNEIYYFGGDLQRDADAAARVTMETVAAMKAVDPSIRVTMGFCAHRPEWTAAYLPGVRDCADMLSLHFYLTNEFDANYGRLTDTLAREAVKAALLPEVTRGKRLRDSLGCAHLPFGLDEWGYCWGGRSTPRSALTDALLLDFLCGRAHRYGIEKALYFHPVNEGLIRVEPDGAALDLAGEAFRLFGGHRGGVLCEAAGLPEGLRCTATRHDGGHLYLTAINAGATENELALDGVPDGAEAEILRFDGQEAGVDIRRIRARGGRLTIPIPAGGMAAAGV